MTLPTGTKIYATADYACAAEAIFVRNETERVKRLAQSGRVVKRRVWADLSEDSQRLYITYATLALTAFVGAGGYIRPLTTGMARAAE